MDDYASSPTCGDILHELRKAPPMQLQEAAQRYVGLRVHWPARFWGVQSLFDGMVQLAFSPRELLHATSSGNIYVNGHPSHWPELRDAVRGRRVDLWGTVAEVDWQLGITLDLDRLELFPESLADKLIEQLEKSPRM